MKTNTRLLAACAILIAAGSAAFAADEKSHRKAAEELLKVMGVDKQLQSAIDQTLDIQIKSNPQIAPMKETMKKFLGKHMSWDGLKEDLVSIYAEAFTEPELNQIRTFYQTPTGKKMVEKMPELMAKGMQLGMKRVQDNQQELRQMLQEDAAKQSK